jgi:hypothetical protein
MVESPLLLNEAWLSGGVTGDSVYAGGGTSGLDLEEEGFFVLLAMLSL